MSSPFPGMNPYIEHPAFWSSFHTRLIVAIAEAIEPQLGQQYYVEVESRTYQSDDDQEELLIGVPDGIVFSRETPSLEEPELTAAIAIQTRPEKVSVPMPLEVKERYLEVREMVTDQVITVIELLSPKNKRNGEGRAAYEKKRRLILGSKTHLVELDLLRGAKPMELRGSYTPSPYRILVSRSQQRPTADLYSVSLQQVLPSFPIPLKLDDAEPVVALQNVFNHVYERGRYGSRIDYHQSVPPPKLTDEDKAWVETQLASLRNL